MTMPSNEICTSYRQAKNQCEQITILADLNATTTEDIIRILEESGIDIPADQRPKPTKPRIYTSWTPERLEELERMHKSGASSRAMAAAFDTTPRAIDYQIRTRYKKSRQESAVKSPSPPPVKQADRAAPPAKQTDSGPPRPPAWLVTRIKEAVTVSWALHDELVTDLQPASFMTFGRLHQMLMDMQKTVEGGDAV